MECTSSAQITSPDTIPDVIDVDMSSQETSPVVQEQTTKLVQEQSTSETPCTDISSSQECTSQSDKNVKTLDNRTDSDKISSCDNVSRTRLDDNSSVLIEVDSSNSQSQSSEQISEVPSNPLVSSGTVTTSQTSVVSDVQSQMSAKQTKVNQELNLGKSDHRPLGDTVQLWTHNFQKHFQLKFTPRWKP